MSCDSATLHSTNYIRIHNNIAHAQEHNVKKEKKGTKVANKQIIGRAETNILQSNSFSCGPQLSLFSLITF